MHENAEGFLYPQVDEANCIECGACEKACIFLNPQTKIAPQQVLAVKNRNAEERLNSSSGGVFLPLAKEVIDKGGVVFGAVYDEAWEVHHVYTDNKDGLRSMMCSKYMQSRIENTYQEVESFLKRGRVVLFVGTPCQISGLKSYLLHKEYKNLLAVDILCHGTPSPGVWRQYIAERYGGYKHIAKPKESHVNVSSNNCYSDKGSELRSFNSKLSIGDIRFRDKTESGWGKYRIVVTRKGASVKGDAVWTSEIHSDNLFMRGFLSDIYLRPSCYTCRYKNGASHSDLTIGDFWGICNMDHDFDDDKGVGLVLINTPKGQEYFANLYMETMPASLLAASRFNGGLIENTKTHPRRELFFRMIGKGETIENSIKVCLRVPLLKRLTRKGSRGVKIIIKWLFGKSA